MTWCVVGERGELQVFAPENVKCSPGTFSTQRRYGNGNKNAAGSEVPCRRQNGTVKTAGYARYPPTENQACRRACKVMPEPRNVHDDLISGSNKRPQVWQRGGVISISSGGGAEGFSW